MMLWLSKSTALVAAVGVWALAGSAALAQTWSAGPDMAANEKPDGTAQELSNPNAAVPQWSYGYREEFEGTALGLFAGPGEHTNDGVGGDENLEGWATPGFVANAP